MARWPNAIAELQGRTPRSVKRYKFYVYYTLIMRVYKQITFMAQSTLGNRHRHRESDIGIWRSIAHKRLRSNLFHPIPCHPMPIHPIPSWSGLKLNSHQRQGARMRTQIIW